MFLRNIFDIMLMSEDPKPSTDPSELGLHNLHVGSIYRWVAKDWRCWVPWFDVANIFQSVNRPADDTVVMYLGREQFSDNSVPAYIFLAGEKKYAVWNNDVIHGLQPIKG